MKHVQIMLKNTKKATKGEKLNNINKNEIYLNVNYIIK
jgi:hypothetical protein